MITLLTALTCYSILAQVPGEPTISWWWETAQKIGPGASFVLGVVVVVLWKAWVDKDKQLVAQANAWQLIVDAKDKQFQSEVAYSKERDKQTLTVMIELTTLIKGIDTRDISSAKELDNGIKAVLEAVADLKNTIREHLPRTNTLS